MTTHRRHSRWLPAALALTATAALALAAICGPVEQEVAEETVTPEATLAAADTATADTATAVTDTETPGAATLQPTDTATPEPAATPLSVFRFPNTRPLPAAVPGAAMIQTGVFWIDARPAPVESLVARIGGQVCGTGRAVYANEATFSIEIASTEQQPGCGTGGAPVTLSMNGRDASGSFPWHPSQQQPLNVVSGPAFAQYFGHFEFDDGWIPWSVVPMIDGHVCGQSVNGVGFQGVPVTSYYVVVDPDSLASGCGHEGAIVAIVVTGRLGGAEGPEEQRAIDSMPWQTGMRVDRPQVDARQLPAFASDPVTPRDASQ